MRAGDWVVCVNIALNVSACLAYAWQRHWTPALYWLSVLGINMAVLKGLQ